MIILKEKNFWLAAVLVFLLDQVTKIWALYSLPLYDEIVMNKYISLSLLYNEATIMMVHDYPFGMTQAQFVLMWLSICVLITVGIWWVIKQPALNTKGWTEEFAKTGLFLILGSAWGNAFDRIFREGVVDFIQLNFSKEMVPVINFADVMVYMGEFCVIVAWFLILFGIFDKWNKKINFIPSFKLKPIKDDKIKSNG